jgi:transposase
MRTASGVDFVVTTPYRGRPAVRITSVFRNLLQLKQTTISDVRFEDEGLVLEVRPQWRIPRCSGCGRMARSGYDSRVRRWRHLDLGAMQLHLRYKLRRVSCKHCGVRVEKVPWAAPGSWFTYDFEHRVAYLTQRADKTTVVELMGIAWTTVGDIAQRVTERLRPGDRLDGLVDIGVDELSVRRHHKYITCVVDHRRSRIVWAGEGKDANALQAFFDELGPERCAELRVVTTDMSPAYRKAVTEACPQATQALDRFHVQRLAHDAVDEVRRAEVNELTEADDKRALKKTRWALQKNPWNLNSFEFQKLSQLPRINKALYRAYMLKEALLAVLDRRQVNVARRKLKEWCSWASRARLKPFVKLSRTIRGATDGILAYVRTGLSNGRTEALNGKIRALTRRAYGFHHASAVIALIYLCCSGTRLYPERVYPASHMIVDPPDRPSPRGAEHRGQSRVVHRRTSGVGGTSDPIQEGRPAGAHGRSTGRDPPVDNAGYES